MRRSPFLEKLTPTAMQKYGFPRQARQCMEETGELCEALNKYVRLKYDGEDIGISEAEAVNNLAEEIADVYVMLFQIEQHLGIEMKVDKVQQSKEERLEYRTKTGK